MKTVKEYLNSTKGYNPHVSYKEMCDGQKYVEEELTGPGGHVPDGSGPCGLGNGPGNGKGDGTGLEEEQVESQFGDFPMDAFHAGLETELAEHPEVGAMGAAQLVLDHLKEDSQYYTKGEGEIVDEATGMTTRVSKPGYHWVMGKTGDWQEIKIETDEEPINALKVDQ